MDYNAKIEKGAGYMDITNYPYGGCFRRAKEPIPIKLMGVYSHHNDGSPKEQIVLTGDGRKIVVRNQYIELIVIREG